MVRVGLARSTGSEREGSSHARSPISGYGDVRPPFHPAFAYPELVRLFGPPTTTPHANPAYAAVRSALAALGLDRDRYGSSDWNPLGSLVPKGGRVVLKPNFIRHWNPSAGRGGSVDSVITHGSIVRAMADYALLAVGREGRVTIAEAPQMDCAFEEIRRLVGLTEIQQFYRDHDLCLDVIDLRREEVVFEDGVIVARHSLPGDPLGYRAVDLGAHSFFEGCGLDPRRFRGADYDPGPTVEHHSQGRHAYLLSETVLRADLVVNLPKLKTHKKTGITIALKNLVGINGDKNWLPHHSVGSAGGGGDEYPEDRYVDRWRSRATELARPLLARGWGTRLFRAARRVENAARGDAFVRSGNWWGNRTTWRMCLDLNRAFYYSDAAGIHLDAPSPCRQALHVADGIVAGEGEGPLAPRDVPLGVVLASLDPVALDLTAIRLMGFDADRIPKVAEAMKDDGLRITQVRRSSDVVVAEVQTDDPRPLERSVEELAWEHRFEPHPGWAGHIELRQRGRQPA